MADSVDAKQASLCFKGSGICLRQLSAKLKDSTLGFFSAPLLWDLSKVVAGCCENLFSKSTFLDTQQAYSGHLVVTLVV